MAVKHRKLLPNQNSTCPEGDDGCYDPAYGDYFLPLPPPPPRPTTPSVRINQNTAIAGAAVASLLLLACYIVLAKICFGWIRRNRATPASPDGGNQEFADGQGAMDHPIWYIRTIGLQPSIINTITVFKYRSADGLVDGRDCSVCLSAFREDEILRLLPKCNHAFHIRCIDTWLRSHTNCPLCRAAVASTTANRTGNELNQEPEILQLTEIEEDRETVAEEPDAHGSDGGEEDGKVIEEIIRFTRRSLSVDSSMAGKCSGERLDQGGGGSSRNSRTPRMVGGGGGSIAECLHKRPVLMKRPFSYGGRSMSCRH